MSRALLVLSEAAIKVKAHRWIDIAPPGTRVEFKAPKRSLDQNSLMWKLLTELAEQLPWHGQKLSADDYKILMLDGLKQELRPVPNISGRGFVNLGRSSSDLSVEEMSMLIELIYMFGAAHDVVFSKLEDAA